MPVSLQPVPRVFYFLIRYVVPFYLMVLLVGWISQDFHTAVLLTEVPAEHRPVLWLARFSMLFVVFGMMVLIWRRQRKSIAQEVQENR